MEKVKNFLESTKVKVAAVGSTLLSAPVLFAADTPTVPSLLLSSLWLLVELSLS